MYNCTMMCSIHLCMFIAGLSLLTAMQIAINNINNNYINNTDASSIYANMQRFFSPFNITLGAYPYDLQGAKEAYLTGSLKMERDLGTYLLYWAAGRGHQNR